MVQTFMGTVLAASLVVSAGCSSPIKQAAICTSDEWSGYRYGRICSSASNAVVISEEHISSRMMALERERDWLERNQERLVAELEAAKRQNIELERHLDLTLSSLAHAEQNIVKRYSRR